MPIDASIAQGVRPIKLDDPMEVQQKALSLKHLAGQQELQGLQVQQQRQGFERQARLRDLLAGMPADTTDDARIGKLRGAGYFDEADKLQSGILSRDETRAKVGHLNAQTGDLNTKTWAQKREKAIQDIAAFNSPEEARASLITHVQAGDLDPNVGAQIHATIPQDPGAFRSWQLGMLRRIMSANEAAAQLTPKLQSVNNGKVTSFVDTNAVTNPGGPAPITMTTTPGEDLSSTDRRAAVAAENARAAASRAQADRHFNAQQNAPQYMETDAGLVALPKRLAPGQLPTGTTVMGPDGQALGKPLKDIPAGVNTAIISNQQNLSRAQQALKLLQGENIGPLTGDKNATGWKGYLPNGMLNRADPAGVDTRAMISDLGSMVLHDRSGAAVTAAESPRLMPFIPLATDDAATAAKKLTRFIQVYKQEQQALSDTYSKGQGYKPSPVIEGGAPDVPKVGAIKDGYVFAGGDPASPASWKKVTK